MTKEQILIVEDEADIQQLVSYNLIRNGFQPSCADSGEEALQLIESENFACILLDLMLPGISGTEVCKTLRDQGLEIPIIMMTAKGEEEDIIHGLETGADDYIPKPFSTKVLLARIRAALRRRGKNHMGMEGEILSLPHIQIDLGRYEVKVAGSPVHLTTTEFGILTILAQKPGWVYSRQQLIDAVRGYEFLVTPRAIDVQIFGLRKKLGCYGKLIETVRGIGYKFSTTTL